MLQTVEIENGKPERSIIWMHGLGASGHDFEPIVPMLGVDRARFVFPHAPEMPVTLNGGMVMPSWYDIQSLSGAGRENLEQVRESQAQIEQLIQREVDRGISVDSITLAGFSQGGAMALHTGLRYPQSLAGIVVLSAYLLNADGTPSEAHTANHETPIFFAHGESDPVVRFEWGQMSCDLVRQINRERDLQWRTYSMAHEVCPQEILDIGAWLNR